MYNVYMAVLIYILKKSLPFLWKVYLNGFSWNLWNKSKQAIFNLHLEKKLNHPQNIILFLFFPED